MKAYLWACVFALSFLLTGCSAVEPAAQQTGSTIANAYGNYFAHILAPG